MNSTLVSWLVAGFLALSALLYWKFGRAAGHQKPASASHSTTASKASASQAPMVATAPNVPVSFGYKLTWLAVRTTEAKAVAQALHLQGLQQCSWEHGVEGAYAQTVFVTPAVAGWTLVAGRTLPFLPDPASVPAAEALVSQLSQQFGEAQYFSSQRVIEAHGWVKGLKGKIVRAYAYVGDQGETVVATGPLSAVEPPTLVNTRSLAAQRDTAYLERPDLTTPTEELVMKIAAQWSVDPTTLDTRHDITPGFGWQGRYVGK
jgi:hypothetical protein